MRAAWFAFVACAVLLFGASGASAAFAVPAIQGHVSDYAGVLTADERADVERRLTETMAASGAEIAVFVPRSLEGEAIEDVAYRTFNAWRVGRAGLDNGVLLVIAPTERRIRIETGKGVGGQLTDLQASDIIEHRIAPRLRAGHYYDAIVSGTDAIAAALGGQPATSRPEQAPHGAMIVLLLVIVAGIVFLRMRFGGPLFFSPGGRGPGPRGGGMGGGGGGTGGGGYSGGGGHSGGGGASGGW